MTVIDIRNAHEGALLPPLPSTRTTEDGERAARRDLQAQIAKLEGELAGMLELHAAPLPAPGRPPVGGGLRMLSLGELERVRDRLSQRIGVARAQRAQEHSRQAECRLTIERMFADPRAYKWARVQNGDIGDPGCKSFRVIPHLGPIGLLMNWWRVKISSGCPLAKGRGWCRGPESPAGLLQCSRPGSP